jgi:hypothetical protein
VHWHGHWELIRNPRTDSNGTFHAEYQFQGSIGSFPFRAEIPAGQTNLPYTRGYSNTINISTGVGGSRPGPRCWRQLEHGGLLCVDIEDLYYQQPR